jgi:hypothetical protein
MAANAPVPSGGLRGQEPETFDGLRHNSERFAEEFATYKDINHDHDLMANPYRRVLLALSYMRGPNVNDWKAAQRSALNHKVNRTQPAPIARTDEILWQDFEADFTNAFQDTTKRQKAVNNLQQLRMYKGDLDTYVARFKHLAEQGGYDTTNVATVDIFVRGLQPALMDACLSRDTPPTTLDGWIAAARTEQQKYANKLTYKKGASLWMLPTGWGKQTKSHNQGHQQSNRRHPNDQVVPMDIDGLKVTTEKEKKKHRDEGRCFECHKTGHVARYCPNKKRGKENQSFKSTSSKHGSWRPRTGNTTYKTPFRRYENARSAHIEEVEDDEQQEEENPPDLDIQDLAVRTAAFSDEQKEQWVEAMKDLGVDFQQA